MQGVFQDLRSAVIKWMDTRRKQSIFKSTRVVRCALRGIQAMERAAAAQGLHALAKIPLEQILDHESNWCVVLGHDGLTSGIARNSRS